MQNEHSKHDLSRRTFMTGAAMGVAAMGMAAAGTALADEAATSGDYTYADTVKWDAEYDVVVLGIGFSGLISAMEAADNGASVLICEKMDEGKSGGNSKVCGQMFAYADNDVDAATQYYTALAAGRQYPDGMLDVIVNGVAGMAETLSDKFGMNRDDFMDCSNVPMLDVMSPEYPEFPGADKITLNATHQGVSDSYLYQSMKTRLANNYADKVDVWFNTPGTKLIQDPQSKAVIGVTVSRNGEDRNVRALNGVCVCTGGFEDDAEMVQNYLGVINYAPIGGLYNTGDGIKMCLEAGARLWHMHAYEGGFGMNGCGYNTPEGVNAAQISVLTQNSVNTGATIIVGDWGRRYQDESFACRHGHMPDGNGIWENPAYPEHSWVIWDKTQMDAINADELLNGDYVDTIVECATIEDAAATIGCEADVLSTTIDNFNSFAANGVDYEWDRPADTMRAFDGASYYVMPLKNLILNTQGGPERNPQGQIVGVDGEPIPHLYSAGEMGGITACMYQGGTNVAECFIFGQIAGKSAAEAKDPLPAYQVAEPVESTPAHLGDETDLTSDAAVPADDGSSADDVPAAEAGAELTGTGKGIGGNVPVTVTLDDNGAIATVTVGDNSETAGIGSKAIEQLPEQFVGLSTADEIDAVDGVSGATITSNAIKDAIKQAMGL